MHVQLSFPVIERVPTWVFAETPQRTNQSLLCSRTLEQKKNRNKVADGREISMDYVAIPASHEPPGFEPTPREL